jgi:mono/diheme cytochrome c family protein
MAGTLRSAGWSLLTMLVLGLAFTAIAVAQEGDEAKPEMTVEEVMETVHMAPEGEKTLLAIVLEGNATQEQKQKLLDAYINMAENDPPMGELQDWRVKTYTILREAAKVAVGRKGAEAGLKTATNCAACHKAHKPPQ